MTVLSCSFDTEVRPKGVWQWEVGFPSSLEGCALAKAESAMTRPCGGHSCAGVSGSQGEEPKKGAHSWLRPKGPSPAGRGDGIGE